MKRLLRTIETASLCALLLFGSHQMFAAAPQAAGMSARTPVTLTSHDARSLPLTAFQKMEARRATAQALSTSGLTKKRQELKAREQKFMAEMQRRMPNGAHTPAPKPMQSNATNGLAVNFPGFLQGEVNTAGSSATEPGNTLIALSVDVDKDGLPDLVNVQLDGTVNVLLNPGKGKLNAMQLSSVNQTAKGQRYVEYAAAVDLHGTGYPDIVMLDFGSNTVLVLPNMKDGTYGTATSLPINFSSGATFQTGGGLAFGDVNGDGSQDMVAYVMTYGYNSQDLPATSFELITFPGKGDGTFAAPLKEQFTLLNSYGTTMPNQALLADVNHDGKLDFTFMAGGFNTGPDQELYVTTLVGAGDGTFTNPPPNLPTSGPIVPGLADGAIVGGISVADYDGDGIPDVLFSNCEDSNLYLALGKGDGSYQSATKVITTFGYPGAINFADVDGDGITDVIAYGYGYIAVYPGLGKGAFSNAPSVQMVSGLMGFIEPQPADFNGDGTLDLAATDQVTNVSAVYLETAGKFAASPALAVTGEAAALTQVVATADFNGDGFPDVLALDFTPLWNGISQNHEPYPNVVVGTNDGKGNFTYQVAVGHEALYAMNGIYVEGGLIQPIAVDFNGDKKPDILLDDLDGGIWIALSQPDGSYAAPTQVPLTPKNQCAISRVDAGDLDGDGKLDLVIAYPGDAGCSGGTISSGVYSLLSKGDGTFATSFTAVGTSAYEPKLIDFNGDGKLDLALSDVNFNNFSFGFEIVPGNGDGSFNTAATTQPLGNSTAISAIIPGDFDGDGKQDLVVGVEMRLDGEQILGGTTGIAMFKGNGDFSFGFPQDYFFGAYPADGKFADFNGDGKPDLALNVGFFLFGAAPRLSNFGYMINLGGGNFSTFQPSVTTVSDELGGFLYAGDFNVSGNIYTGDFNGDGAVDVLSELIYDDEYHYASQLYLSSGGLAFGLTASEATADQGTAVTLTAAITPSISSKTPSGTVSFYDNGTLLLITPVSGTTVTASFSSLPVGANVITASYSGDSNLNAAVASAPVTVAINALAPNFTLSAPTTPTITLAQGATGTTSVTLTGNATFNGTIALTCVGVPSEASCTVIPASIALAAGQSVNATIVIATTPKNNVYSAQNALPSWMRTGGGVALATMIFLLWPGRRRRMPRFVALLLIATGTLATFGISGCGGTGNKYPGTTVGSSTLTITATSGSITQTQKITLTVTKSN